MSPARTNAKIGSLIMVFVFVYVCFAFFDSIPDLVQTQNTAFLLSRTGKEDEPKITTETIRHYCKTVLKVPYNYSEEEIRSDTRPPDDYYAKLQYIADHLYISDDYKFMYLAVPKVACSNWKRLMLQLKNVTDEGVLAWPHDFGKHKRLSNIPKEEWRAVLQDYGYYKFAFVRNPWTRLVSAYVDRFTRHDKWWYGFIQKTEGKRMIRNHRAGATEDEIAEGADVRFEEFVKDILDFRRKSRDNITATNLNEHWNPEFFIAGLCHPWIDYDFIARYEDLDTASVEIFERVGLTDKYETFPRPSRNSSTIRTAALEFALLDKEIINELKKQLRPDMEMLGYSVPEQLEAIVNK